MTAAQLRSNANAYPHWWALAGLVLAILFAFALSRGHPAEARTATKSVATLAITPAKAAALVAETSGVEAQEVKAVGAEAKLINAAMPFDAAPVRAARPFEVGGDSLDHRRALLCLTQAVYYEAGFEPIEGRRAVAQVVLNRLRHPAYPKSVCGVVYQRNSTPVCQFSFVCDGSLNRAPAADAWRQAREVAAAALAGYVETAVGSATHYHADYVAPRWAPLLAKVVKLGAHIFYRWPGAWGMPAAFTGRYIGEPNDPANLRPLFYRAVASTGAASVPGAIVDIPAGPPIARAPNDVGGLLDTSKGWRLSIPTPWDTTSASSAIAQQQHSQPPADKTPTKIAAAPSGPAPVLASR